MNLKTAKPANPGPFDHVVRPPANGARIVTLYLPKDEGKTLDDAIEAAHHAEGGVSVWVPSPDKVPILLVNFGFEQKPTNGDALAYAKQYHLKHASLRRVLAIREHCRTLNSDLNVYNLGIYALEFTDEEGGGSTQYFFFDSGESHGLEEDSHLHDPNDPNEENDVSTWFAFEVA